MANKDLLATNSLEPYPVGVENERLWQLLGAELARIRMRAGYTSTLALSKDARDAPAKNTLDDIERGRPGTIDKIEDPFFKSSSASYFLQLVDFAAWSLLKREVAPSPFIARFDYQRAHRLLEPICFKKASRLDPLGIVR